MTIETGGCFLQEQGWERIEASLTVVVGPPFERAQCQPYKRSAQEQVYPVYYSMLRQAGLVLREEVGGELTEGVVRSAHSCGVQNCHKVPHVEGRIPQADRVEVDYGYLVLLYQELAWGEVTMNKGLGNCRALRP